MNLQFNEADHTYTINGIYVPGCSTVSGMLPKSWAMPWAAKETCGWLEKNWVAEKAYKTEEIARLLKEAKGAFKRKAEKAADHGSRTHELCERFVKEGQEPLLELEADEVKNAYGLFSKWAETVKPTWLHSELVVGSEKYMFGGKFDAICVIDGVTYLIDFKTSNGYDYYEYPVQTAGYQIACEEMGIKVDKRLILWVPKVGNKFKAHVIPTPLELDKKCFLACLDIYRCVKDAERIMENEKA